MNTLAKLIITLVIPWLLGFGFISLIFRNNRSQISALEVWGLSWGIGLGLLGLEMFIIALLNIPLTFLTILIPTAIILMALGAGLFITRTPGAKLLELKDVARLIAEFRATLFWPKVFTAVLFSLISLTVLYVFFDALVKPILNFDDLWRQGCIAKIIFVTGQVITPQTLDLAGPHPFLNPLSQAWIYLGLGAWNDPLGKVIFALCFLALILIFYANLRKDMSRRLSLIFVYLLTSFPLIIYHAGTAYSDFLQTFYYTAGVIYLYRWWQKQTPPYLYTSAILLGLGTFVKQAGIPLWVVSLLVLFAFILGEKRSQLKQGFRFTLLSAFVAAPWLFYQNSFLMRKVSSVGSKILVLLGQAAPLEPAVNSSAPSLQPTLGNILQHLTSRMFTYADWQILWFVFGLTLVFCWQHIFQTTLKYLLLIIGLDLIMVIWLFFDPASYQFLVDGTLVNRILMNEVPVVLFFTAQTLAAALQPQKPRQH
ncbi:hypothetical protein COT42_03765 [Candidatus Saganbacteria bacterium CG08_land_8_20_14_0_20_45_16]|uniref:Glycosyltransferase RgtA/B/C/D-like domain-containing protein n=1 Tax=Candidatus Saganbacteria bacterium CG08_land_8_20_14_0_20_45_16 TaxID=2014293 RepID=A0A2H0Y0I7_UNCSA|nr:MAG: hypothetical protein COT42_03765 [Candidatus Saganbacteria bacterium CG08_land_8_20_14_0_20_45_16]